MDTLRHARRLGSERAMAAAGALLSRAVTDHVSENLRARIFELAEALFQSIRMQLSVPRYKAISVDRGANLDTVDAPLNDCLWLTERFDELRKMALESYRLAVHDEILNGNNPRAG